jgi:hypothetical protein
VECSAEQREELEALEAIFMEEYSLISTAPARFSVKLRAPGTSDEGGAGDDTSSGPVSAHFTLKFTLPAGYPGTPGDAPHLELIGPLGANNPLRAAAMGYYRQQCTEQQEQMGGAGYAYTLVEAMREWIDEQVPADEAARRAGKAAADAANSAAAEAPEAGSAGQDTSSSGSNGPPWWEKEEADPRLIQRAIAEAAAASWSSWAEAGGTSSGDAGDPASDPASPAPAAAAGAGAEGLVAEGDGSRGRWDYVIGLVGKPSAGKSTFFNAVTGEC